MLRRLGYAITVFAFLTALGAHWVLLQSVAWTSMLAHNLQTESLTGAVARTFDGRHPCPLCTKIAKSKRQEHKAAFTAELTKFEFTLLPCEVAFARSWHSDERGTLDCAFTILTHAPPVPPPRAFQA